MTAHELEATGVVKRYGAVLANDRVDLVGHLTFAFPVRVIARILGLPEQDVANFQRWSLDLINMFNDPEPGVRALEEFHSYFMAFITERRLAPRDDLISDLIQSEVDGHRLDDDAIFASVKMVLPAGVETTYRSLGNLLVGLLTHTDQLHALQHDRALIGPAIEEGLPWQTPFLMVARQTTRDTDLAGIHIPADQHVFIFVASANHDERRHSDPEAFNISRTATPTSRSGLDPTCASECTSPGLNPTPRSNASWTAPPTSDSTPTNPNPESAGRCSARPMH